MADRKSPQTEVAKPRTNAQIQAAAPPRTVRINEHAVADLACYGSQAKIESLFRETDRTVRRLRARVRAAKPYASPPRGQGAWPGIQDIILWLDSLTRKHDLTFVKRLHKTLAGRVGRAFSRTLKAERDTVAADVRAAVAKAAEDKLVLRASARRVKAAKKETAAKVKKNRADAKAAKKKKA